MTRRLLTGLFALPALLVLALAVSHPSARTTHAEAFVFQTDMYGTENLPPVTTVAYGFVRFFFNEDRTAADYNVDVKGYSANVVTGADIHKGAKGVNGPAVKHLADGGFIVTGGHMSLSAQDLRDLEAGLWYVSLKTIDHPEGALRGQVIVPAGFFPSPPTPLVVAPPLADAEPPSTGGVLPAAPQDPVIPTAPSQPIAVGEPAPGTGPVFRPPNTGDGGLLP